MDNTSAETVESTHDNQTTVRSPHVTMPVGALRSTARDLVCFSHLRWDFVFQRPQHLLSRVARERRVFYVEEPLYEDGPARIDADSRAANVMVVRFHLPNGTTAAEAEGLQGELLDRFFREQHIQDFIAWYYTPMALGYTAHLHPVVTIYDCMDELSAFKQAPRELIEREAKLFARADLVFTGGQSLYEAKRHKHPHVYAFPSSVDVQHFGQARSVTAEPGDQASVPHPRLGFFGVIDERMDLTLLDGIARARPNWHLVILGPVVKIDPADLPRRDNIHYLGAKKYGELPGYLAGWDVALLPFAQNESTRFISPTKTPEYLAGGKPVVSTPILDVVRPYGELGLVKIADTTEAFVQACEEALTQVTNNAQWLGAVDAFLAQMSWDRTWDKWPN